MRVLNVDSKSGKVRVNNSFQKMAMFLPKLAEEGQRFEQMLKDDPAELQNVENRIHDLSNRGDRLFVARILANIMQSENHIKAW